MTSASNLNIRLRPATISDLDLLEHWDRQPHVIACDPDESDWANELQRSEDWLEQLIAELDGQPIGVIQIIDPLEETSHYWGNVPPNLRAIDIWIGEAYNLNKGYGTIMMQLALEKCFAPPEVSAVLIDPLASNTKAHRFYERLGFRFVEERIFEGHACFVYELKRVWWMS
ncbi:MAG: GNAT family N-acetyltransferase [Cyclobacteriaceae bacterium]